MKIKLENLYLDKENPRFTFSKENITEEDIFLYLKEYEVLDELIGGIKRTGFFQIGEKPIVMKKNDQPGIFVVLEGNRRVCALKALHGFYSQKYEFDEQLKAGTSEIDVDVVNSREEVQPYLAARHIQGIKLWKPEARRNFYYKHYVNGKSLTYIQNITEQKLSEIKSFIKQAKFLDFFKNYSSYNNIDKPSLIYERIQRYFVLLKLVKDFEITELNDNCKIEIETSMLSTTQFKEFCRLLADGIFGDDKFIDSRTINKFDDFKKLLKSSFVQSKSPKLSNLYNIVDKKLQKENFVPTQKLYFCIKDKVPMIKDIIDYDLIKGSTTVKIMYNEKEITEQQFRKGIVGTYLIKINEHLFEFEIRDFQRPEIKIFEERFKQLPINNTIDLSNKVAIYDVHGQKIDLTNKDVSIRSNDDSLKITKQNNILIQTAGMFMMDITYSFQNNPDYTVTKTAFVRADPFKQIKKLHETQSYFDFKFVDVRSITSMIMTGKLLDELEENYLKGNNHIFVAALRSVVESAVGDLSQCAKTANASIDWCSGNVDKTIENIKGLTKKDLCDIAHDFAKKHSEISYKSLKNYLGINISSTPTGHTLDQVIDALHLGAHKSLAILKVMNIAQIQPYVVALLELLYIIIDTKSFK